MTYVLLFVDNDKQPRYLQGTLAEINKRLAELWEANEIDTEDWEYYSNYDLLYIEDGQLQKASSWEAMTVPQFTVT
jgi:hypothetical protein